MRVVLLYHDSFFRVFQPYSAADPNTEKTKKWLLYCLFGYNGVCQYRKTELQGVV